MVARGEGVKFEKTVPNPGRRSILEGSAMAPKLVPPRALLIAAMLGIGFKHRDPPHSTRGRAGERHTHVHEHLLHILTVEKGREALLPDCYKLKEPVPADMHRTREPITPNDTTTREYIQVRLSDDSSSSLELRLACGRSIGVSRSAAARRH